MLARSLAAAIATFLLTNCAHAHGIAGNRLFPGTLAFDDPAVSDEFAFSPLSSWKHRAAGGNVVDNSVSWSLFRLLTPTIAIGLDSGWAHRNWGAFRRSGFETTNLTLKGLVYKNEPSEMLVSASLTWGIGRSGAQGVGANAPDTIRPALTFGKGFGDLPDNLAWLRPIGITGAIAADLPISPASTNFGIDPMNGQFGPMLTSAVDTLRWGFSIQYSTYYLTKRFTGAPPKEEPLNQFVPLVEFAFDSPRGQKTIATMNPGLAYVGQTYQVAIEAIVPLNSEAGRSVGVRTQLLLFLDDLAPSFFGKPLLSR